MFPAPDVRIDHGPQTLSRTERRHPAGVEALCFRRQPAYGALWTLLGN